jgi:hypothetical protein
MRHTHCCECTFHCHFPGQFFFLGQYLLEHSLVADISSPHRMQCLCSLHRPYGRAYSHKCSVHWKSCVRVHCCGLCGAAHIIDHDSLQGVLLLLGLEGRLNSYHGGYPLRKLVQLRQFLDCLHCAHVSTKYWKRSIRILEAAVASLHQRLCEVDWHICVQ